MLPRFFKDMPPKGERRKTGEWIIQTIAIFPMKDSITDSRIYKGKKWMAYLIARYSAFIKDWNSPSYYGIGWRIIEKREQKNEC